MHSLSELFAVKGPFASVALRSPSAVDDATAQLQTRWKAARSELEDSGADTALIDSLEEAVHGLEHGEGEAVVMIQAPDRQPYVEFLSDDIAEDLAVLDALPRVGALLESRQRSISHVVVMVDRAGADIVALDGRGESETLAVDGETEHIHRGHPGGWSQRRFQQRAENQWEKNAAEVAGSVAEVADEIDARLICVAGDVRAVGFLHEHLPQRLGAMTHELQGQSEQLVAEESVRAVADLAARDTIAALEQFADARASGMASSGAREVCDALSLGRVETLLVHDDPADDRRGRFDPLGLWCSASPEDTEGLEPGQESVQGRLVDIAIRGALKAESGIRFVPSHGGPDESIGAVLRW